MTGVIFHYIRGAITKYYNYFLRVTLKKANKTFKTIPV